MKIIYYIHKSIIHRAKGTWDACGTGKKSINCPVLCLADFKYCLLNIFAVCRWEICIKKLFNFLKFSIKIQSCGKTWVNLDIGSGFQLTNTNLRPWSRIGLLLKLIYYYAIASYLNLVEIHHGRWNLQNTIIVTNRQVLSIICTKS